MKKTFVWVIIVMGITLTSNLIQGQNELVAELSKKEIHKKECINKMIPFLENANLMLDGENYDPSSINPVEIQELTDKSISICSGTDKITGHQLLYCMSMASCYGRNRSFKSNANAWMKSLLKDWEKHQECFNEEQKNIMHLILQNYVKRFDKYPSKLLTKVKTLNATDI